VPDPANLVAARAYASTKRDGRCFDVAKCKAGERNMTVFDWRSFIGCGLAEPTHWTVRQGSDIFTKIASARDRLFG
jgi:hypothetical protein